MAILKFKIEDVDNEIVQIIQQSQRASQIQQPDIVQSLLERAKQPEKPTRTMPKPEPAAPPKTEPAKPKAIRKKVERDQEGRIASILEEEV